MTTSMSPGVSRSPRTGLASRGQGQGVQGWKMNCLRPAPPTRSFFQADKRNTLRRKGNKTVKFETFHSIVHVTSYRSNRHVGLNPTVNFYVLGSDPEVTI